jgi:cellulose synthase/poly-beta-1,6-N-acetylglucosamine synthase-like glycosyltransferase
MTSLASLAYLLITIVLTPFFLFMLAIVAAAFRGRATRPRRVTTAHRGRSRFLIVIPAHDEEGAIGATVRSCQGLDYDRDLFAIHVIADNCTDGTALEAREAGASVVERSDPDLRSKGHALEYFFTRVPEGRPDAGHDATVLIDADTVVAPALLKVFDRALGEGKDWVQGYYTVRNPNASWRTRMMTYAFSLANGVWMLGLDGLGLGVGLKGNGMCFSSAGLRRVPWKAHGLVEDMEFALMLRVLGERVRFEPEALVFGEMVSKGGAGAASQRRRWEAGRRSLRGKFAGELARSAELGPLAKASYLLDLFFPPLATLALGLLAASSVHPLAALDGRLVTASQCLLPVHAVMVATFLIYALSPTAIMGLPVRYLASLLALPYYISWKIFVALGRAPKSWVRTPRESPSSGRI